MQATSSVCLATTLLLLHVHWSVKDCAHTVCSSVSGVVCAVPFQGWLYRHGFEQMAERIMQHDRCTVSGWTISLGLLHQKGHTVDDQAGLHDVSGQVPVLPGCLTVGLERSSCSTTSGDLVVEAGAKHGDSNPTPLSQTHSHGAITPIQHLRTKSYIDEYTVEYGTHS